MKKICIIFGCCFALLSCDGSKSLNVKDFRTGTFEIPAGDKFQKTIFIRKDSLQIEMYNDRVDSLSIFWKDNFNYTLRMLNPKSALDKEPIRIKITGVKANSYDFEAIIGLSNFKQKGTVFKTAK